MKKRIRRSMIPNFKVGKLEKNHIIPNSRSLDKKKNLIHVICKVKGVKSAGNWKVVVVHFYVTSINVLNDTILSGADF